MAFFVRSQAKARKPSANQTLYVRLYSNRLEKIDLAGGFFLTTPHTLRLIYPAWGILNMPHRNVACSPGQPSPLLPGLLRILPDASACQWDSAGR